MDTAAARALRAEVRADAGLHLRDLLADEARCAALAFDEAGVVLDLARQRITARTLDLLLALARERDVPAKIRAMYAGDPINTTEGRAVLHVALREPDAGARSEVRDVRDRIWRFAAEVRDGRRLGATGRRLTDTVAIGIGGSSLGPEFLHEALRTDPDAAAASEGRRLRFLANVDPIDVHRALDGLDPETTLVVVVSKTFTTAETLLNARTVRRWITSQLGEEAVRSHMIAVSTALPLVAAFGIDPENAFGFWDWVGGRYSATSAVGLVPLALQYGEAPCRALLDGAHRIDVHFRDAPLGRNLPVLLGLVGVWNATFLGHGSRAFLPYCQALHRLPAHLQQVSMESNGKGVDLAGAAVTDVGPVEFGEPGTNGQHSFYQLIHQGRVVPCDFVGFRRSQRPMALPGEVVANHDELMANFFAQPDALALGKDDPLPHKRFTGNRPSSVWLLEACDAANIGRLLALVEHRTAVEGFVWGLDSFDQWGVELGKVLAGRVRSALAAGRSGAPDLAGFNPSTAALLRRYLGVILLAALAWADEPAPYTREGFGWGALPAINYNTDEGLGLGALGSLYRYDGTTNPYRWALSGLAFVTTRGIHSHSLELDALKVGGRPLRILGRVELQATRTSNYCGTDPAAADCDPAEAEAAADAASLSPEQRADFVRHYYQARFVLPQARVEARWALDPKPHELSAFVLAKVNTLIPGDFSERGPYPGSLYAQDFPGGEDGETSVLSLGLMLDDRDFEPAPSRGYWVEASVRGASRFWGSDWEHVGANATLRGYVPLGTPRVVLADRVVLDALWGEASSFELGQSGGSQRYEYYGSLQAGRGVRLRRFVGEVKAMEQAEIRATVWSPQVGKVPVDLTVLGFSDTAFLAEDLASIGRGVVVPAVGGGLRLAFDGNFILRGDVGVSPVEGWSPSVYLDIRNTY